MGSSFRALWGVTLLAAGASPAQAASVLIYGGRGGDQIEACAAVTTSGYLVAWVDARPLARQVLAATSRDGVTWTAPASVSGPGAIDEAMRPSCAARGDLAIVAWATAQDGDHDVWAARSQDGGATFDRPLPVAIGAGGQLAPRAAIGADGRAYVVFHDSFGSTADDGGVAWHVRLSTRDGAAPWGPATTVDRGRALAIFPAIAVSEAGRVQVAYLLPEDGTIAVAASSDRGERFSPPIIVADAAVGPPSIAARGEAGATVVLARSSTVVEKRDLRVFVQEASYLDVVAVETSSAGAPRSTRVVPPLRALNQLEPAIAEDTIVWLDHAWAGQRRIAGIVRGESWRISDEPADRDVSGPAVACGVAGPCLVVWSEEGEGGEFDVRASIFR